jgi:methylase of polypeptide subunit release factors
MHWMVAVAMFAAAAVAGAKLPAPTPEQQEAAAAKKEQEKGAAEKEKQLLEKAQDRVVAHYRREKGGVPSSAGAGKTETTNISAKAVEGKGEAGPKGGTKQSAEAHSAPAK